MRIRGAIIALGLVTAAISAPAVAGTLIVSGDTTIASRFVTAVSSGTSALAGNIAFQRNIVGSGTNVAAYRFSVVNSFPNPPLGEQLAGAYASLGYNTSLFDGGVDAAAVADADLIVILGRDNAFTGDETVIIRDFLFGGGNVLLTGESANIGFTANNNVNALAAALGSTIRLDQVTQGIGDQFATDGEIIADPLTSGVTSFGYGRTTTLTGGRTLFVDDFGGNFVAADTIAAAAVPESSTWAMMIGGLGLVGGMMRRRKSVMTALTA